MRLAERLEELEAEEVDGLDERTEPAESLAARLRQRRGEASQVAQLATDDPPLALLPSSTTARAVIDHLGDILPPADPTRPSSQLAGLEGPLPRGLLARTEWNDLVLTCVSTMCCALCAFAADPASPQAEEGDIEGVMKGLELMEVRLGSRSLPTTPTSLTPRVQRTTPIEEGTVLEQALAIYASQKRPQDALALAGFARQRRSAFRWHPFLSGLTRV